jgi:hypothetical protein
MNQGDQRIRTGKGTDGTASHWKYVVDSVIVYRAAVGELIRPLLGIYPMVTGAYGELIRLDRSPAYVQFAWCSSCATEFTYAPDCDWVTFVLPGMWSCSRV